MTDATRYKTIATIAVAFSLGNLFATACGGGGKANAEEQDISGLVSQIADLTTALAATEAAASASASPLAVVRRAHA